MITLNGHHFAENDLDHQSGVTLSGTAKRHERQIDIFDLAGQHAANVNRHGTLSRVETTATGRKLYSAGAIPAIGGMSAYQVPQREINALAVSISYQAGNDLYRFKA